MDKKRLNREIKREVKKGGNRARRRYFQDQLRNDPENAHCNDYEFDEYKTSTHYNNFDHDATRKKKTREDYESWMYGLDNLEDERDR